MKQHFLESDIPLNHLRFTIFELMSYFEKIAHVTEEVLAFRMAEPEGKDHVELFLIEMGTLHKTMTKIVGDIESAHTEEEQKAFEKTSTYRAMRRTFNFLQMLNVVDLNEDAWLRNVTHAVMEPIYYRRVKSLVY